MSSKRNELANPKSCLNQASDDEPIFTLRAHDELAPGIVRYWAGRYYASKQPLSDKQHAKYREALQLADEMEEWRSTDRDSMNK